MTAAGTGSGASNARTEPACIFCEALATNPRYTTKFGYFFEPGHYFLWADYDLEILAGFIRERICHRYLDGDTSAESAGTAAPAGPSSIT